MPKVLNSKRHRANLEHKPEGQVPAPEAVAALKKFKGPKFDQTVNVVMHLGIDTAQADQAIPPRIASSRPDPTAFTVDTATAPSGFRVPTAIAARMRGPGNT